MNPGAVINHYAAIHHSDFALTKRVTNVLSVCMQNVNLLLGSFLIFNGLSKMATSQAVMMSLKYNLSFVSDGKQSRHSSKKIDDFSSTAAMLKVTPNCLHHETGTAKALCATFHK